tara:strand:+ start:2982 stop:3575 length:594 start_codon:yes stop_codon:yes gene_type:complete
MKKIGIIDSGTSNISSIIKSFQMINTDPAVILRGEEIKKFDLIILPGVGTFPYAIKNLKKKKIFNHIIDYSEKKKKFLGICLGMQLLSSYSNEIKKTNGINQIPGKIVKIKNENFNIGWKKIKVENDSFLSRFNNKYFYFQHQYKYEGSKRFIISTTHDHEKIPSIIIKNNIIGVQFHPEKSQENGLNFLKFITENF